MITMNCPKCDAVLEFEEDELDEGDEFTCEECGADIHVLSVDPIELEAGGDAPADGEEEFDEDDEDDEFEEDEEDGEEDEFEEEDEE